MADTTFSAFQSSGSASNVDVQSLTNGNLRQSVVVGDSSIPGNVAPVQATDPSSSTEGLVVRDVNTSAIVAQFGGSGIKIRDIVTGTITVQGNNTTLTVFIPDTGHTIGKVDAGTGTFNVQFDPGHTLGTVIANTSSTAIIPLTASGTASGVSTSGNTIIAPTTGRNFKIYAYAITTTAVSSVVARFTNGAGVGPTEFWRLALQSSSGVASGANLAVMPPGYLFATGTSTTLSILLDSGMVFHYSVSYFEESA